MKVTKPLAATASLALVVGSCAAVGLSPMTATAQVEPLNAGLTTENTNVEAVSAVVNVSNVQGVFGYSQTLLTKTADIMKAFVSSNASLCASMPDYEVVSADPIKVVAGDTSFIATVGEMAEEDEAISMILACACASNPAGGGIIANAEVGGISMASVAQMIGVASK